ncbi:MAG: AAA family ATPase [Candidatus Woesearchaeota archaeon]
MMNDSLERLLRKSETKASNNLEDSSFFASANRFGGASYTPPKMSRLFSSLVEGFGKGYLLEDHFKDLVETEGGDKRTIVLHELAKSVADDLEAVSTVQLYGKADHGPLKGVADAKGLMDRFVKSYRQAVKEDIISNEQGVVNYAMEFFDNVRKATATSLPEYSLQQDVRGDRNEMTVNRNGKNADTAAKTKATHGFADVIGLDDQKALVKRYLVNPLSRPEEWRSLKERPEKLKDNYNFLFYGPPGTGKTYFAQAIAGELDIPFFTVVGSDFVQSLHGEGKNKLAQTYKDASQHDASIVFIDEADTICYKRGSREAELKLDVTTEFLTTLDGVKTSGKVATILSTNMKDEFDRAIISRIPEPNRVYFEPLPKERYADIFRYHLDHFSHEGFKEEDLGALIERMDGVHPRAVSHISQSAALYALDRGAERLSFGDVESAVREYLERGERP